MKILTAVYSAFPNWTSAGQCICTYPKDTRAAYKICVKYNKQIRKLQNKLGFPVMYLHMSGKVGRSTNDLTTNSTSSRANFNHFLSRYQSYDNKQQIQVTIKMQELTECCPAEPVFLSVDRTAGIMIYSMAAICREYQIDSGDANRK